jgi:predicted transcriptional regulator
MMNRATLSQYYEILTLLRDGPLGRRTLVARSTITESTVRTHLRRLEQHGYVRSDKQGTAMTDSARQAFSELLSRVTLLPEPVLTEISVDSSTAAALVSEAGSQLQQSVRYRDDAVRGGATGAVLLTFSDGRWYFSDSTSPLMEGYPQDGAAIDRLLESARIRPRFNDGLLLSFGPTQAVAASGLWSIIATLISGVPSSHPLHIGTGE